MGFELCPVAHSRISLAEASVRIIVEISVVSGGLPVIAVYPDIGPVIGIVDVYVDVHI